jgi:hypothetical protein
MIIVNADRGGATERGVLSSHTDHPLCGKTPHVTIRRTTKNPFLEGVHHGQ